MSKQKKYSRWWLGLTIVILAGLALWYFQPKLVVPSAIPLAQTQPAAPTTTFPGSAAENLPNRESAPAAVPAVVQPAAVASIPPPVLPVAHSLTAPERVVQNIEKSATVVVAAKNPSETAATARMYAAHSSLRAPELADPDSATNKQILGTMVAKLLTQPATPPPASVP